MHNKVANLLEVYETIKVQYESLDYKNESDQYKQIDNRIFKIQQDINIARDKLEEYNDIKKKFAEMYNLLEEINEINDQLWGFTDYSVKEVPYS
ncbi:8358_t:CDS:2 [Racocetra persica]|uniref:8358_t:CDS:1 n=1 Tax=Racocetra persica TaxID=160502 RepID=A0ACA9M4Q3_9GLOM|nr:8358_t:CDS:2 [Racocetra persica]